MKTIEKAITVFKHWYPEYGMELDKTESCPGYYVIYVTEPVLGLTDRMIFTSVKECRNWIHGVVLE